MKVFVLELFDYDFYVSTYPDVASLPQHLAQRHWLNYGYKERRKMNPAYCWESYLCRYADLRNASWIKGSHLEAYKHFLNHGRQEGRIATPMGMDKPNLVDLLWGKTGYGKINFTQTLARIGATSESPDYRETRIGIIDTGVTGDYLNFYLNDPVNGIDDDNNGIIDDNLGYDFYDKDIDPSDPYGHGSAVATVIHSLSPVSKISAIKAGGGTDGAGTTKTLAEGIEYAVKENISLVNISMGGKLPNPDVEKAVGIAKDKGVILVCAAGNTGGHPMIYPAQYTEEGYDNVIAVGASQENSDRLYSSAYWASCECSPVRKGNFVIAKGVNIVTNSPGINQGTSLAAPQVTALIASLMNKSFSPLSNNTIIDCLTMSCSNISPS